MLERNNEKAKQKEYLKPFMLVNKYVTASLFYFKGKKELLLWPDRDAQAPIFLISEDTPITSEMH